MRLFFLRILPRRLVPIFFAWDAYQLYKNRHQYYRQRGEEPPGRTPPKNVTPGARPLPSKRRRPLW